MLDAALVVNRRCAGDTNPRPHRWVRVDPARSGLIGRRLEATTLAVLAGWKAHQTAEFAAVGIDEAGWVFTDGDGEPIHPHALSQAFERIARRAGVPVIRLHDLRHTHGTLLIKEGVPVKVVSERLGHANIAFTIETYHHVLPGMQTDAARAFEALVTPSVPPGAGSTGSSRWTSGRTPPEAGRRNPDDEGPGR